MDTFRDGGFAATSLDDLSEAMGINRPSLYGTFGDKRDLFLKAYEKYRAQMAATFAPAFDPALTLRQMLEKIYAIALDVYLAGENGPRGCFTVMTATSEAMADPEIRSLVQRALGSTQRTLRRRWKPANCRRRPMCRFCRRSRHRLSKRWRSARVHACRAEIWRRWLKVRLI